MGTWGRRLYQNDVALDVKSRINDILDLGVNPAVIEQIIAMLNVEYDDDDDRSIAWIVAADCILKRGIIDGPALYRKVIVDQNELSKDEIEAIIQMMRTPNLQKKPRRIHNNYRTDWNIGDLYIYDIRPEYRDESVFSGWNIGFLCVDFYAYRGKHPIVYAFRTKYSQQEIRVNPDIAVMDGDFWKVGNWGIKGYAYQATLWTEKESETIKMRFHYCGKTNARPRIDDEFVVQDAASLPSFHRDAIESGLLRTKRLMIL